MASLKELRRRAGLTQPQLAQSSGINQQTISLLELGKIPGPRVTTIQALARGLRVAEAALLDALMVARRNRRVRTTRKDRRA